MARRQNRGIDVQVGNQYIVAPPSVHPSGTLYRWHTPPCPVDELPDLPDAWIEQVLPHRKSVGTSEVRVDERSNAKRVIEGEACRDGTASSRCRAYVAAMPTAIQGQGGHSALLRVAYAIFHGFGLSESEGWPIMLEYNARCLPPWDLGDPAQEKRISAAR